METITEYEKDFYAWLIKNAQLIRNKQFTEIDAEQIAEELESMGRSEKRELISRLTVLLAHLLKWQFQSVRRDRSWNNTILTQRIDIHELLKDSPSLRSELESKIEIAYEKAKLMAEDETGIDKKTFSSLCPFSLEQILDNTFFPEDDKSI
ncbi:hypothetical protein THII_0532 [Thioploca ingrica]|uniref:DUF29 domain-containing protein n=1 Tax=Thioploca ingrica TaxID=40754 RepID=A0A090ADG7_9GAMM|nr:hypothetical protein THII_0532 [Thioploca ingrica]